MTKKVFTQEEEKEVFEKLHLLADLLQSKMAPAEDSIELRRAINQFKFSHENNSLEVPVEALRIFNRLWKKYNGKKKN